MTPHLGAVNQGRWLLPNGSFTIREGLNTVAITAAGRGKGDGVMCPGVRVLLAALWLFGASALALRLGVQVTGELDLRVVLLGASLELYVQE